MRARAELAPGSALLANTLERLAGMDLDGLQRRWRARFGRAAPAALSPIQLHRVLAYRLQADALGELDRGTIQALARLADHPDTAAVPTLPERRATKPGTLLVREWAGVLQTVMVLDDGFAWQGRTYDSLSAAARAITGTAWNGPRFFGLRKGPASSGPSKMARPARVRVLPVRPAPILSDESGPGTATAVFAGGSP